MTKPPTMEECERRGLVAEEGHGIHTFSNGTEWECWASGNCFLCKWWSDEKVTVCAWDVYAQIGLVSPAMALLFGWTRNPKYTDSWDAPDSCRFFSSRDDRDGERVRPPKPTDPLQLVLIADPTEVIHGIQPAVRQEVSA